MSLKCIFKSALMYYLQTCFIFDTYMHIPSDVYTWGWLGFLYLRVTLIYIPEGVLSLISLPEGVFDFYTWGRLGFLYLKESWISIPEGVLDFYTWRSLGFLYLRASWISIPEGVLDFYTWGSLGYLYLRVS